MTYELEVLYEGDNIMVVNKPPGLVVHADGRTNEPSVADWVVAAYPETHAVGEPIVNGDDSVIERPGIVHRLDRNTSGALIIARSEPAYKYLKRQFQNGDVRKTYRAFVYGKIKQSRGSINRPIGRSKHDFRQFSAARSTRGRSRDAMTVYNVIVAEDEATYLTIIPKTGRTHQIRVHLKALHHPVVCDSLYAPGQACLLGFKRLALHAHTVTFRDTKQVEHTIEAPLPDDFVHAENELMNVVDIH